MTSLLRRDGVKGNREINKMSRILFLSNIPTPYQLDFLDSLAELHEIRAVFLWGNEQNRDWILGNRFWMEILESGRRGTAGRRFAEILHEFRPDAILVGGYRLPFLNLIRRNAKQMGSRIAYWLEKPLPSGPLKARLRRWLWRARLPFAYGVVGIGREAVSAYAPFVRHTLNLPYSIDVFRYRTVRSDIGDRPIRFLFVGQLIPRKGIAELLEAFSGVAADEAQLSIAGSGDLKPLVESYVQKYPHIEFTGFVGPDKLPELYASHDILVMPSRHDGWAVVVCEAMAAGMPIIGTMFTGAFAEYVRHRHTGFRCHVSVESIREGIDYYSKQRSLIREHGRLNEKLIKDSNANAPNAARALSVWLGLAT